MTEQIAFYCLTCHNETRLVSMQNRFEQLGLSCRFWINQSDEEFLQSEEKWRSIAKYELSRCMYGHFKMIQDFVHQSELPYGIFCEDDIFIHKDFVSLLPQILSDFESLDLDVLLLGYLTGFEITYHHQPLKKEATENFPYRYHYYHDNLWGTQMYMLSRKQAIHLLEEFSIDKYLEKIQENPQRTPWSADWILTKNGNRALIAPLLVVENDDKPYEHYNHPGQFSLHHETFNHRYDKDTFI